MNIRESALCGVFWAFEKAFELLDRLSGGPRKELEKALRDLRRNFNSLTNGEQWLVDRLERQIREREPISKDDARALTAVACRLQDAVPW